MHLNSYKSTQALFFHIINDYILKVLVSKTMLGPIEFDVIDGPFDEGEETVSAANELAEKYGDQINQVISVKFMLFENLSLICLDVKNC